MVIRRTTGMTIRRRRMLWRRVRRRRPRMRRRRRRRRNLDIERIERTGKRSGGEMMMGRRRIMLSFQKHRKVNKRRPKVIRKALWR